jgi:hypothetical protein
MNRQPDPLFDAAADEAAAGRPWWKVCCMSCCLGMVALVVAFVIGIRWLSGPGPRTVRTLPGSFPSSLVLFRPEEATEILHYPAASKRGATRLVTGPMQWVSNLISPGVATTSSPAAIRNAIGRTVERLEGRDTVAIRWEGLASSPDELLRFYTGALRQAGIGSPQARRDPSGTADELTGKNTTMSFSALITDDPITRGTDSITVVVEYVVE